MFFSSLLCSPAFPVPQLHSNPTGREGLGPPARLSFERRSPNTRRCAHWSLITCWEGNVSEQEFYGFLAIRFRGWATRGRDELALRGETFV